jgi:16S rRNA (guanine966-N2)-methyltransferase
MRIIAGERRGHRIDGPRGPETRPTSDLVRESVFNILRHVVAGRVVVDLFAGTGALGLEALSRGAARAIFVEQNRENVALIYRNFATLRYEDRVRVLATDAYRWARSFRPADDEPVVVFVDPPYREYEIHSKKVHRMLAELVQKLPEGSVIVVESGRALNDRILPDFEAWDVRRYGGTQVAIRMVARGGDPTAAETDQSLELHSGTVNAPDVLGPTDDDAVAESDA